MPTYKGGRHEHGQNYLNDPAVISKMVDMVANSDGSIVEIGPGRGVLTRELEELKRPLTAIEIDPESVSQLRRTLSPTTTIVHGDFLDWSLPRGSYTVVGNVPFHLTTPILRKLLHEATWTDAVLLVQWEVARRRAGVGGASMMTAQWWPWVDFSLRGRVSRTAFTPAPSVGLPGPRNEARRWTRRARADPNSLPKDLSAEQWASLYHDAVVEA